MLMGLAAGRLDVDNWMEEEGIDPAKFDEWVELNAIVPIGDEKVCRVLALGFSAICNRMAEFSPFVKDATPVHPDQFLPWKKGKKTKTAARKTSREYVSPNQAAAMFVMATKGR